MEIEKLWVFLILAFILVIATFNIIGSLTMLIIEKKKDITIRKGKDCINKFVNCALVVVVGVYCYTITVTADVN